MTHRVILTCSFPGMWACRRRNTGRITSSARNRKKQRGNGKRKNHKLYWNTGEWVNFAYFPVFFCAKKVAKSTNRRIFKKLEKHFFRSGGRIKQEPEKIRKEWGEEDGNDSKDLKKKKFIDRFVKKQKNGRRFLVETIY